MIGRRHDGEPKLLGLAVSACLITAGLDTGERRMQERATGDSSVDLRDFGSLLWKRKWMVVASIAAVLGAALLLSFRQTPVYASKASVLIEASSEATSPDKPNMATEKLVAGSPAVAKIVLATLHLVDAPGRLLQGLSVEVPVDTEVLNFSWGPVRDTLLGAFMDWLQNAGQPGGAPAGVVVQTVRSALNSPDSTPPATTALCNGSQCQGTYGGSASVRLSASDTGGVGVTRTYYTTDGSTPTQSSPVYSEPLVVLATTTVKFFSVDNAGNAEPVRSQLVQTGPNPDPVVGAAGDIACDPATPAFNGGSGTLTDCRAKGTSNLLIGVDDVLALGDDQYNCGGVSAFAQSYDPTWGRFKSITHPVPGDEDYNTSGGTDCPATPGAGYYSYFGSRAGDPAKGYYSYNLGSWHVIALNSAPCGDDSRFCKAGSDQEAWLRSDLAASSSAGCTLAFFQNPRFASRESGGSTTYAAFWQDLYAGGADVVLNGDSHWYERFQPMNGSGGADSAYGVREFIVATGGAGLDTPYTPLPTSEVLSNTTHGVLKMTLHDGGYDWTFVHDSDGTFTDSGTASCHGAPPAGP